MSDEWDDIITTDNRYSSGDEEIIAVGSLERIIQEVKRKWEKALKLEGLSYLNAYDKSISVDHEINSLVDYTKLMCFYSDTEGDRLYRKIFFSNDARKYFKTKTLNKSIIPSTSFVKMIIDNKAILYDEAPDRIILNNEEQNTTLQSIVKESNWNAYAQSYYNKLKLTNLVAVRPVVRNIKGKSKLQFDIYTPDRFRVRVNNDNEIDKILYEGMRLIDNVYQEVIYVWTDTEHYYIDMDGMINAVDGNPQMSNPYGVIPFVFMQLNDEDGLYAGGNYDIIESVIEYNIFKLLTMDDAVYSSFNLLWTHDVDLGNDPKISPRDVINTHTDDPEQQNPQINFVNSNPHFKELNDQAISIYKQCAKLNAIPAFLISDSIQEFNSSKAMRTGLYQMLNERKRDAIKMADLERELTVLVAKIINYENEYNGYPYTLDINIVDQYFEIDYVDPSFEADDPMLELEYELKKAENHISNFAELYQKYNNDAITTDQAIQKIQANKEINRRFESAGISWNDLITQTQDTLGTQTQETSGTQ